MSILLIIIYLSIAQAIGIKCDCLAIIDLMYFINNGVKFKACVVILES